jgi:hypothetical protein
MYTLYSGSEMSAAPGRVRLYGQIKAYRDLGGVHVWHAGVSWIEGSRCAAWFTRAVAPVCRLRVFEGADAGGRARLNERPVKRGRWMRLAGACRSTWELPLGCCGGARRWAVGVCWRASSGKVEMKNESLRTRFRSCCVERDVAAIKDEEGERLTAGDILVARCHGALTQLF